MHTYGDAFNINVLHLIATDFRFGDKLTAWKKLYFSKINFFNEKVVISNSIRLLKIK